MKIQHLLSEANRSEKDAVLLRLHRNSQKSLISCDPEAEIGKLKTHGFFHRENARDSPNKKKWNERLLKSKTREFFTFFENRILRLLLIYSLMYSLTTFGIVSIKEANNAAPVQKSSLI